MDGSVLCVHRQDQEQIRGGREEKRKKKKKIPSERGGTKRVLRDVQQVARGEPRRQAMRLNHNNRGREQSAPPEDRIYVIELQKTAR